MATSSVVTPGMSEVMNLLRSIKEIQDNQAGRLNK